MELIFNKTRVISTESKFKSFSWANFSRIKQTLFISAFENDAGRSSNKRYYLPSVEVKDYNVMNNGKNFWSTNKK